MGDQTSAGPISEQPPAAAPDSAAPASSAEVTNAYDSSTKPEDKPVGTSGSDQIRSETPRLKVTSVEVIAESCSPR